MSSLAQVENITKMIGKLAQKHRGEIYSIVWDWDLRETNHPRIEGKIQHWLPMLVIDFK